MVPAFPTELVRGLKAHGTAARAVLLGGSVHAARWSNRHYSPLAKPVFPLHATR